MSLSLIHICHAALVGIIHILIAVVVFHKEAKHILVSNGILDKILVKTVAEDFLCGMSVNSILDKERGACKTEYLSIVEELHDEMCIRDSSRATWLNHLLVPKMR